jgi:tRNA-dihydrouridine synthase
MRSSDELEGSTARCSVRVAYHDPYFLAQAGARLFGEPSPARSRAEVLRALLPYAEAQVARGVPLRAIAGTCSGSITDARVAGASARSCRTPPN